MVALEPQRDRVLVARDRLDVEAAAVAIDSTSDPPGRAAIAAGIERMLLVADIRRKGEIVTEIALVGATIVARLKDDIVLAQGDIAHGQNELGHLLLGMSVEMLGVIGS